MSASFPAEGGCLCGAVRFRLIGPPFQVDYCHCHSCRKHTGAPVSVFVDCKRDVVEFTKGAMSLFESSPGRRRGFCSACGSTISWEGDECADEIHIHVGAMDQPDRFPPNGPQSFPEERVAWFHVRDEG